MSRPDARTHANMHTHARTHACTHTHAQNGEEPVVTTRAYELAFPLKYGCNPHQVEH